MYNWEINPQRWMRHCTSSVSYNLISVSFEHSLHCSIELSGCKNIRHIIAQVNHPFFDRFAMKRNNLVLNNNGKKWKLIQVINVRVDKLVNGWHQWLITIPITTQCKLIRLLNYCMAWCYFLSSSTIIREWTTKKSKSIRWTITTWTVSTW